MKHPAPQLDLPLPEPRAVEVVECDGNELAAVCQHARKSGLCVESMDVRGAHYTLRLRRVKQASEPEGEP